MTRSPRRVGLGLGLKSPWSSSPGPFPVSPAAGRELGFDLDVYTPVLLFAAVAASEAQRSMTHTCDSLREAGQGCSHADLHTDTHIKYRDQKNPSLKESDPNIGWGKTL